MMRPICHKRRITKNDDICRVCRAFIRDYIDSGLIEHRTVPMAVDVALVMDKLGIDQDRAVMVLGGAS